MTDPDLDNRDPMVAVDEPLAEIEDTHVGISPDTVNAVIEALDSAQNQRVRDLMEPLHFADAADLLENLSGDQRRQLMETAHEVLDPDFYSELDETVRDEVVDIIGLDAVAKNVAGLDIDDAIEFVNELEEDEQRHVLDYIPAADRTLIEEGLSYPEDSAGRLMQRHVMTVPKFWSVGETIDYMRANADEQDSDDLHVFYDIIVVDPMHKPVGAIPLSVLLQSKRVAPVVKLMHEEMRLIPTTMDQEEIAFLFRQRDLVSAPVVDDDGRLAGIITIDDVVDVMDEEAEDDIMRLGGLREDDLYAAALDTTKSRFSWLFVNLITAVLASSAINLFQATIEQVVALAVLMPIVASMGGNAGTQTLTVAVRALATKELTTTNAMRQIGKELMVGGINGVVFAILMGSVAWLWFASPQLGVVIGLAMIANMLIAGVSGAAIPILLERVGIDPALASSVFLTTITDVVGFMVFLGLGTAILL